MTSKKPTGLVLPIGASPGHPTSDYDLGELTPWDRLVPLESAGRSSTADLFLPTPTILTPIFSPSATLRGPLAQIWGRSSTADSLNRDESVFDLMCFVPGSLADRVIDSIENVMQKCGVPLGVAGILLRLHDWSADRVISEFGLGLLDELVSRSGLGAISEEEESGELEMFECPLCWDDVPLKESLSMKCGHRFCVGCWKRFCTEAIESEGIGCLMMLCPSTHGGRCQAIVCEEVFRHVCSASELKKYEGHVIRSFVSENNVIRWCPTPDCGSAVECLIPLQPIERSEGKCVACDKCQMEFCFVCSRSWHPLCSCREMTVFESVLATKVDLNAEWIKANCKECPACKCVTKKDDGCNHMICKQCKHEYCWVCMGDWGPHGTEWYNCVFYQSGMDAQQVAEAEAARERVAFHEKFQHYENRFLAKRVSEEFAKAALREIDQKKAAYCRACGDIHPQCAEFLEQAFEALSRANRLLRYTYVRAYTFREVPDSVMENFAASQAALEQETDELAELLRVSYVMLDRDAVYAKTRTLVGKMTSFVTERS